MFGTNPIRKQELENDGTLAVQSIFYTIQGEGPFAGLPAVFIRLAGCNLRCHYCDTDFESGLHQRFDIERMLEEVRGGTREAKLVVLTGGEPFRQDIRPLVAALVGHGYHVQIETAGTLWLPGLEQLLRSKHEDVTVPGLSIVVSPKTGKVQPEIELFAIAWKYIVKAGEVDPEDGLPNVSTQIQNSPQSRHFIARPPAGFPREKIFIQPCYEYHQAGFQAPNLVFNRLNTTAAAEICMKHGYRLSLQQHKIAGLE